MDPSNVNDLQIQHSSGYDQTELYAVHRRSVDNDIIQYEKDVNPTNHPTFLPGIENTMKNQGEITQKTKKRLTTRD